MPALFLKEMLPWMLQSPLFPHIALLMASTAQSLESGVDLDNNPEALGLRARVLSFTNQFLQRDFDLIAGEALRSIINLAIAEVCLRPPSPRRPPKRLDRFQR